VTFSAEAFFFASLASRGGGVKPFIHAIAARLLAALWAVVSFQYNRVPGPISQDFVFYKQKQRDRFSLPHKGRGAR
jgi:hypothetical protein